MFELVCLSILGGLFSGFSAGLFGIGGGSFLIPFFLYLLPKFGASSVQVMHQAVATSLAIIIPSSLSASYKQYQLKNIDIPIIKKWIPCVSIGLLGALLVFSHIPSVTLTIIYISYLSISALYICFQSPQKKNQGIITISFFSYAPVGLLVGILSTFLGVGGGTMTTPYFMVYQYPLKKAIAISSVTGVFIGFFGSLCMILSSLDQTGLARFSLGYVHLFSVFLLTPFCIIAANYGVKIGNRIPSQSLKIIYAGFILSLAVYVYCKNIVS